MVRRSYVSGIRSAVFHQLQILWGPECLMWSTNIFSKNKKQDNVGISLVVQWLRIHLAMQGIQVLSLVWN